MPDTQHSSEPAPKAGTGQEPKPELKQQPASQPPKPLNINLNPNTVELSKAMIGCLGTIGTALVTGLFLLIANSGMLQRVFSPPSPTAPSPTPITAPAQTAGVAAATPLPSLMPTQPPAAQAPTSAPASTGIAQPTSTPSPIAVSWSISPITFAAGVASATEARPIEANDHFPAGITKVFAIFSFEAMEQCTPWSGRLYHDGKLVDQASALWQGRASGTTYLWEQIPEGFTPGIWEWRISVSDTLASSGTFSVIARSKGAPSFGPIQFAQGLSDGRPVQPYLPGQFLFPAGITQLTAYFRATDMVQGTHWEAHWYYDGNPLPDATQRGTWVDESDPDRYYGALLAAPEGLANGPYALKLIIEGEVAQLATFIIQPGAATEVTPIPATPTADVTASAPVTPAHAVYGPVTIAAGATSDGAPIEPRASFPQSITQIVAIYEYELERGTAWHDEWLLDGQVYQEYGGTWTGLPKAIGRSWLHDPKGLPPGKWELRSYAGGELMRSTQFTIDPLPQGQPGFGAILFAEGSDGGKPVNLHSPQSAFAADTTQIIAFFYGVNMSADTDWTAQWDQEGEPLLSVTGKAGQADGQGIRFSVPLRSIQPLLPGTYTLKLMIGDQVVQMATLVKLGDQ
jgi:hypothetical protein